MSGTDDGFISRWSKRKRGGVEPAEPEFRQAPAPAEPEPKLEEDTRTDAEILDELGLRDPDEMSAGDDFGAFLKQAVPEHIRKRALHRLWRSNPVLANLDGLNDYDGDFTGGSVPTGTLKTAYQVGRGFVREALAEKEDAPVPPSEPEVDQTFDTSDQDDEPDEPAQEIAFSDEISEAGEENHETEDFAPSVTRRRIVFRFQDQ